MAKVKAVIPDIRGDEWDAFVLQLATHVRSVLSSNAELSDFTFPSSLFKEGVTVELVKMKDHISALLWVATGDLSNIGAARLANLIRWKWWQGDDKAGMSYFLKQYPFPDSDTEIPRDLTFPLGQLGVTPSRHWRF